MRACHIRLLSLCILGIVLEANSLCQGDDGTPQSVQDQATVRSQAMSIYTGTLKPYVGSGPAIQNNLITPLTKGGSLNTASGSQTFTTNSFQSSGTPLLKIAVYQNPATGDLRNIIVQQSSDAATFPSDNSSQMISTVCSNGYVQCDPGTQNNCRYRAWASGGMQVAVAGATGLSDQVGNVASLADCYCFNYGCSQNGNSLIDIGSITANVGGAILAAYLAANPDMAISSAQDSMTANGGVMISYYGLKTKNPNGANTATMKPADAAAMPIMSSGSAPLTSYYNAQATPGDATGALLLQQQTPNSIFSVVANATKGLTGKTFTCTNLKNPVLTKTAYTQTTSGSGSMCTDHFVNMVVAQAAQDTFAIGWFDTSPQGWLGANCGVVPFNSTLGTQGYLAGTISIVPPPTGYGYKVTQVQGYMSLSGWGCWPGSGTAVMANPTMPASPVIVHTSLVCPASGAQIPAYTYTLSATYDTQNLAVQDVRGCAAYESDPKYKKCKVKEETWDGRPYIVNYMPTAFQMAQVCQNVDGPVRTVRVCQPWFRQDKTYYCPLDQTYDFTSLQSRVKGVEDSATMPNASTMSYTDPADGNQRTYGVPTKGVLPPCSQVCQTKIPAPQSVITGDQSPASANLTHAGTAAGSFVTFYKECLDDGTGEFTCPIDTTKGEIVVTTCGCSSDFGSSVSALSAVDSAAQDAVCAKQ